MPDLFMALGVGLLLASATWYFGRAQRFKRKLRAFHLTPIVDAPDGKDIRITGVVEYAEPPLSAPISGRPCAAWHVAIWEVRDDGRGDSRRGKMVVDDSAWVEFIVNDGTGRARVKGTKLTLALAPDSMASEQGPHGIGLHAPKPDVVRRFLLARRIHFRKSTSFRYEEGVLEEGERVTVAGRGTWQRDPSSPGEAGYRDVGRVLHVGPTSNGEILVSDGLEAMKS